jgi:zinc transport system permease protein
VSFLEFISYGFVQRALIAGILIGLSAAMLGVFLVLKRLSLIGDSLSHVALTGVAAGMIIKISPLFAALPIVAVSGFALFKITNNKKIYADSALGIVSAAGLSLGLIITALGGGFNADLSGFLFGSILTVSASEIALAACLFILCASVIYLFYGRLVATIFDENFAKVSGVNTDKINLILIMLAAFTVILALKVTGILLVSALIIVPPCAAIMTAKNFIQTLYLSCAYSVFGVVGGIYAAFLFNLPCGAAVICLNLIILAASAALKNYVNKKRTACANNKRA